MTTNDQSSRSCFIFGTVDLVSEGVFSCVSNTNFTPDDPFLPQEQGSFVAYLRKHYRNDDIIVVCVTGMTQADGVKLLSQLRRWRIQPPIVVVGPQRLAQNRVVRSLANVHCIDERARAVTLEEYLLSID